MVSIRSHIMDLTVFFHPLKDVAMVTNFWSKFADLPLFGTLAFQSGLKFRKTDERIGSIDFPSTSSTNMVNFGPLPQKLLR